MDNISFQKMTNYDTKMWTKKGSQWFCKTRLHFLHWNIRAAIQKFSWFSSVWPSMCLNKTTSHKYYPNILHKTTVSILHINSVLLSVLSKRFPPQIWYNLLLSHMWPKCPGHWGPQDLHKFPETKGPVNCNKSVHNTLGSSQLWKKVVTECTISAFTGKTEENHEKP
jgi:hypothetical protein